MNVQIDVLYTKDCSDWETADALLQQVVADMGLQVEIGYVLIESDRQAIEWFFIGSPTIMLNGQDLFPADVPAGVKLRSYFTEDGLLGHPTYDMLYSALQTALA